MTRGQMTGEPHVASILMYRAFLPIVLLLFVAAAPARAQSDGLFEIFVSVDAPGGGSGSADAPFRTIQDGVRAAVRNRDRGVASRVVIAPGTYREGPIAFGYSNLPSKEPSNRNPIEVVAAEAGTAIVSGSDVWTDWALEGEAYWHTWEYTWGVHQNNWNGPDAPTDIVMRREMIFVDGSLQRQVLSRAELEPGTFFVDEPGGRVWLHPENGTDLDEVLVEVGVRDVLWDQNHEDSVTVRGLVFEHAVTPWSDAQAAVRIANSDDVRMEECVVRWSNWTGLYLGESRRVVLNDVELNHNGGQGWGFFRVRDVDVFSSETSYNNWRGALGGFHGWSVGNKILSAHGIRIVGHRAHGNASRGLWLDYDISDAIVDSADVRENELDGIWIEASQGPITVRRSTIADNGRAGIYTTYSRRVTIDQNLLSGNAQAAFKIGGRDTRPVVDFEKRVQLALRAGGWVITNNTVHGRAMVTEHLGRPDWAHFVNTLVSDQNEFVARDDQAAGLFTILGRRFDLGNWRELSGQDGQSTLRLP